MIQENPRRGFQVLGLRAIHLDKAQNPHAKGGTTLLPDETP